MKRIFTFSICLFLTLMLNAQVERTIDLESAGTLYSSLTFDELYTVTNLTLTGSIDARDFKTMRDFLPLLAEIDLSGVSIVEYEGDEGTNPWNENDYYSADAIPQFAFANSNGQGKPSLTTFVFPVNTKHVKQSAFQNCQNLAGINLPDELQRIEGGAFRGCPKISEIYIPESVDYIFDPFDAKTSFTVDPSNAHYSSIDGILYNKAQSVLVRVPSTNAGDFSVLPTVTEISGNAFGRCNLITTIELPKGLTRIGSQAFSECSQLTTMNIPATVNMIGGYAFASCHNLDTIKALPTQPVDLTDRWNVFEGVDKSTCVLYVPIGSKTAYESAGQWQDFDHIEEVSGVFVSSNAVGFGPGAATKEIYIASSEPWSAVSDQRWLSISPASSAGSDSLSITVSDFTGNGSRTAHITISVDGFDDKIVEVTQEGIIEVTPGNLKTLLSDQLNSISNLTLTGSIDARDFKTMRDDMPLLAEVDLSGVSIVEYEGDEGTNPWDGSDYYQADAIPQFAFSNNNGQGNSTLTTFVFPVNTKHVKQGAFQNCQNLAGINLPDALQRIERGAFRGCPKISEVYIPTSVDYVFESFDAKTSFTVAPSSAHYSSIDGVLYNKTQSVLVRVPSTNAGDFSVLATVTEISRNAFGSCNLITTIELPMGLTRIGSQAFEGCDQLNTINIPATVKMIGDYAFGWCHNLESITAMPTQPVDLTDRWNVFEGVDKSTCVLYVPISSKTVYESAVQWQDFDHIEELSGFFLSSNAVGFGPGAATKEIYIASSEPWSAVSDQGWLSISPASSAGSDSLSITVSDFTGNGSQTAHITISVAGFDDKIVEVTQEGIIEVTPGNLKTLLSDQLNSISNLTLTGSIDARDFKTMRDEMPLLAEVDLSGASIVEYEGDEGTNPWDENDYYPADAIPQFAFSNNNGQGNSTLTTFVFPVNTKHVKQSAFNNCQNLAGINLPDELQRIEGGAFRGCPKISVVYIPESVNHILDPFDAKTSFTVDPSNAYYSSIDGVLYNKKQSVLVRVPSTNAGGFSVLPTVTEISGYAFGGCNLITTIELPKGLTRIGSQAFSGCNQLTTINIPATVNMIGDYAFGWCQNLESITAMPIHPVDLRSKWGVFEDVDKSTCILYVPKGSKVAYENVDKWRDFEHIVVANQSPVANAGDDQTIDEGTEVTLDGGGSTDPDDDALTYHWTAPDGIALSDVSVANPSFIAPEVTADTDYVFTLFVNDGDLNSESDEVRITVMNVNQPPIADAGADQTVDGGTEVTLDGSGSTDPDDDALTYHWIAPDGIALSDVSVVNPSFTAPEVTEDTEFVMTLKVNDGELDSESDEVLVTVSSKTNINKFSVDNNFVKVYPNPSNGFVNIEFDEINNKKIFVSVSNLSGKEMYHEFFPNTDLISLELNDFMSGVYFINIEHKNEFVVKKIMIKN